MDAPLDAYVFVTEATTQAVSDALALVGTTARVVLPTLSLSGPELYVAVADSEAIDLLTKIATVVTISGFTTPVVYLAYGSGTTEAQFPTYGVVADYVGFVLLTTTLANTVSVYEAALAVTGVKGAAMVSGGGATVIVEATSDSTTTLESTLTSVENLTGVLSSQKSYGPVSGGAGFTTS